MQRQLSKEGVRAPPRNSLSAPCTTGGWGSSRPGKRVLEQRRTAELEGDTDPNIKTEPSSSKRRRSARGELEPQWPKKL